MKDSGSGEFWSVRYAGLIKQARTVRGLENRKCSQLSWDVPEKAALYAIRDGCVSTERAVHTFKKEYQKVCEDQCALKVIWVQRWSVLWCSPTCTCIREQPIAVQSAWFFSMFKENV